ncbi:MAG: hypothetical protein H6807_17760 [Planctomycetes bacterium]|nr:hypothetical protein [Planctomycetota bacterium]
MESIEGPAAPPERIPGFADGAIVAFAVQFPFIVGIGYIVPQRLLWIGLIQVIYMFPAFIVAGMKGRPPRFLWGMFSLCALVLLLNALAALIMYLCFG